MIKSFLKLIYRRSVILPRVVSFIRRPRYCRIAQLATPSFNGDSLMAEVVESLIQCGVSSFVETGTYLGHTCKHIASSHPQLPVTTIENNPDFFYASQKILRQYANVHAIKGNSAIEIGRLVKNKHSGLTLFFLDAHWYNYLPLPDEIKIISSGLSEAIMVIHDFQVPGHNDYGFDICNGKAIGMEMIATSVDSNKSYTVFLPNYTYQDAYGVSPTSKQQLRGYAIVFQGAKEICRKFQQSKLSQYYTQHVINRKGKQP